MAALSTMLAIGVIAELGVKTGTSIMQAKAQKKATKIQTAAAEEALKYEREQIAKAEALKKPYQDYTLAQLGLSPAGTPGGTGGAAGTSAGTSGARFTGPTPQMLDAMFPHERAVPGLTRDARGGRIGGAPRASYTVAQLSGNDPAFSNYRGAPATPPPAAPGSNGIIPGVTPITAPNPAVVPATSGNPLGTINGNPLDVNGNPTWGYNPDVPLSSMVASNGMIPDDYGMNTMAHGQPFWVGAPAAAPVVPA